MRMELQLLEKEIETVLVEYEQTEQYEQALQRYLLLEQKISKWIDHNTEDIADAYGLLAQCYLRQGGMLRQLKKFDEATLINKKEIASAKLSGNTITYAQCLFSSGINHLSNRNIGEGLTLLNEAKKSFEAGDSSEHKQGVGWYWIILADLGNKKIIDASNEEVIYFASQAIDILTPIRNFPGISRAYQARSIAYRHLGELEKAEDDLSKSNINHSLT
jgi:tetratricopeptide (TPR) repeat protein